MGRPDLREILDFAVEAAQRAGDLTLGYFHSGVSVVEKADGSPVTAADREAELLLRERIDRRFPAHSILGEEFGERRGEEPARWILDPIDGTFSFIHGVPLYSTLVGFEWQGEMAVGVIHLPALRETVYAARGLGCWWNGRRAAVSQCDDLSRATLLTGGGKLFDTTGRTGAFDALRRACRVHRSWCDGYGYALLATGRADVVLDPVMNIWDVAALLPVVTEAGGRLTDWRGAGDHTSRESLATNGLLHQAALDVLAASAGRPAPARS